jgi:hypothetical protein
MNKALAILSGIGVGAALMYLFDPNGGRRRRALIRDKAVGLSNDARETVEAKARHLSNRAQGLMHEAKSLVSGDEAATQSKAAPRV